MANPWWVVNEPWPTVHATGIKEFPFQAASKDQIPLNFSEVAGPFQTRGNAMNYIHNSGATQPGSVVSPSTSAPQSQAGIPGVDIPNPLAGLAAIAAFFATLGQANTWIRVAEVGLGVLLISVGIAHMTNAVPVATKIATAVGAVAL